MVNKILNAAINLSFTARRGDKLFEKIEFLEELVK